MVSTVVHLIVEVTVKVITDDTPSHTKLALHFNVKVKYSKVTVEKPANDPGGEALLECEVPESPLGAGCKIVNATSVARPN